MKKGILLILFVLSIQLSAQNYFQYHRLFNYMDKDVANGDFANALLRLDTVHTDYDFVYAAHCIKGIQICCVANDSTRARLWLAKAFMRGVPLWLVKTNGLTQRVLDYSTTQSIIDKYDSLRSIYFASINNVIKRQIDSLAEVDFKYTDRVNNGFILFRHTIYGLQWLRNNKRQFKIIDAIIEQHGFPGERLIGIPDYYQDSAQFAKEANFSGSYILDYRVFFMLKHYFSNARPEIREKLQQNVARGYFPAYQFGALADFMAEYGRHKTEVYYNVHFNDANQQNIHIINQRRCEVGLSSYEVQEANHLLARERRRNKTANQSILLEW
jgi:hypothetical protein